MEYHIQHKDTDLPLVRTAVNQTQPREFDRLDNIIVYTLGQFFKCPPAIYSDKVFSVLSKILHILY